MKKWILLSLVAITLWLPQSTLAAFPDVTDKTDYKTAIDWTVEQEITEGYKNGNWGPDDCVTRAQLLKMVLDYKLRSTKEHGFYQAYRVETEPGFPDVFEKDWHYNYIKYAKFLEMIQGYPDGNFKPDQCVMRVEAMKIALKTLMPKAEEKASEAIFYDGHPVTDMYPGEWYAPFVRPLFKNKLVGSQHVQLLESNEASSTPIQFFPAEPMSRKEVAEMLYRINQYQYLSTPSVSYEIRDDWGQLSETDFVKQSLVKVEQKDKKETVLVENIREKYGKYFQLERGFMEGSQLLILRYTIPETDVPSSLDHSLNIDTLEIKPLRVVSEVEHDVAYAELSPDQKFMLWIPMFLGESPKPIKNLYLVDLMKDTYTVLTQVKEGESLDSADGFGGISGHAEWLDDETVKYAVYKASDHSFLEYRKVNR